MDSQEIAMNSIHRLGVTIAGLATVLTVAGAFVAQGYVAAQQASAQATAQATALGRGETGLSHCRFSPD